MLLHGLRSFTIFIYRLYDVYVLLICLLSYLLLICRLLADFMRFSCVSCINHLFLPAFYLIFIYHYIQFLSAPYGDKKICHRRLIETAFSSQIRVLLLMTKKAQDHQCSQSCTLVLLYHLLFLLRVRDQTGNCVSPFKI